MRFRRVTTGLRAVTTRLAGVRAARRSDDAIDDTAPGTLQPAEIRSIFERLLERPMGSDELDTLYAGHPTAIQLVDLIVAAEEYAQKRAAPTRAAGPSYVNYWTAGLSAFTHPPGTVSSDDVAEVGRDGFLFLRSGTNAVRDQFTGNYQLPDDWAAAWTEVVHTRAREADELGARLLWLVVPDKLAVSGHLLPTPLPSARRPIDRLREDLGLPLVYPVNDLA